MTDTLIIGVAGNPNCGKTTLFNQLTGAKQRVGNWPGVTVARKTGTFKYADRDCQLVDLPGIYSLDSSAGHTSLDEEVAQQYLLGGEADVIVNIVDAANLERNLYLTTQLRDMNLPLVVALNMMDTAEQAGIKIDTAALAAHLGVPVIPIIAAQGKGLDELKKALVTTTTCYQKPLKQHYPVAVEKVLDHLQGMLHSILPQAQLPYSRWLALKLLEGTPIPGIDLAELEAIAQQWRENLEQVNNEDIDIVIADARYRFITHATASAVRHSDRLDACMSDRIDNIVLNRFLGIPIFLAVMYLLFLFTINLGGAFIDFFDMFTGALLVDGMQHILSAWELPEWVVLLSAHGIGGGIQVVATFIPIIAFLYLFLSFLEDSGYMARAAFVMDRFMRFVGLPGKSFVPLLVGFGCNVPAVMAARTLENQRDRYLTTLMTPFMSCGARLPVYVLFAAVFFADSSHNLVFALYLLGIAAAVLTGLIMKNTLLKGEAAHFVMELPQYHIPKLSSILLHTWERLKNFVLRAGQVIVPMVLIITFLNAWGTDGSFGNENTDKSVLSEVGRTLTPAFAPMGISEDNWPATVGIFSGVLAKEVVVGTLDSIYSQLALQEKGDSVDAQEFALGTALTEAFATIPANLAILSQSLLDPLGLSDAKEQAQAVSNTTYSAMSARFDGQAGAFAYLLFILMYFPCAAVVAALYRETGIRWALFVSAWSTGMAYVFASLFYQIATFSQHPSTSFVWITGLLLISGITIVLLHWIGRKKRQKQSGKLAEALA
jgi:ferrous iron transport protein B